MFRVAPQQPGRRLLAAVSAFTTPLLPEDFLGLVDPSLYDTLLVIGLSILAIGGIELVRFIHRRYVRRHGGTGDY